MCLVLEQVASSFSPMMWIMIIVFEYSNNTPLPLGLMNVGSWS